MLLQKGHYRYREVSLSHQLWNILGAVKVNTSQKLKNVKKTGCCVHSDRTKHDEQKRTQHMLNVLKGSMKSACLGTGCKVTHLYMCVCVCVCVCVRARARARMHSLCQNLVKLTNCLAKHYTKCEIMLGSQATVIKEDLCTFLTKFMTMHDFRLLPLRR
jgi:hypothetical protein